jgi:predicted enzyme related to lactoylglutathione lyase
MKKLFTQFIGVIILGGLLLTSCNGGITYPSVSDNSSGEYHPGQFVWHDLATPNPDASMDFYKSVFGWEYSLIGSGENTYYVILNDDKPIGGMFKLAAKYGNAGEWVGSISVNDVDAAVKYNIDQGGKTIFDAVSFKGRGETALVQDPQGAIVAFLHADGGDPAFIKEPKENSWLWNELWTNDTDGSLKYYNGLFGFGAKSISGSKVPYFVFEKDKTKYCGVLGNPVEGARSAWMPYIRVSDVKSAVEKAKKAGATIMMEPNENIRKGSVAVILDPYGAQFTVQEWPIN